MPFLLPLLLAVSPIQIDGLFQDWSDGTNHQEDAKYLYTLVELPNKACLQQLPEQKVVELGEYTIFFSPNNKGHGVSCKKGDKWISPYEAGVIFAPTTASTKFEVRVHKLHQKCTTSFDFSKNADIRVVSWNVQFGALLKDKPRGVRLLKALDPDVLLLQELDGDDTNEQLNSFLEQTLGGTWFTCMSRVHGTERHHQLRSAVCINQRTKFTNNLAPFKALYGASIFNNVPVNFFSLHMRCCGGPTGEAEDQRQEEAKKIRNAIDTSTDQTWIVAGDWNLVGTTKPLKIVQSNTLAIVDAFQPDGLLNATWSDTTSSFTPGRLDWMLYSPKTLEIVRSFVLDTSDLDIKTCVSHGILQEDTAKLSDHLPLVADFNISQ
jgi:endonuclease/exonuclease/phosphatase family metal-dependent hydrolase